MKSLSVTNLLGIKHLKKSDIELIFETADPLDNIIFLPYDTWHNKIVIGHPEMLGEEKLVQTVVEEPIGIYPDKDHPQNTNIYIYEHEDIILETYGKYVKVAVDTSGRIRTSYLVSTSRQNTQPIYLKP